MGPGFEDARSRSERETELLRVIAAEFPGRRVLCVLGGFVALPRDAELTTATGLERLLDKLRAERDAGPGR